MVGILFGKLTHVEKQTLQDLLTAGMAGGKRKTDLSGTIIHGNRCTGVEHIVDGALRKADRRGDGGTDNVVAGLSMPAVPLAGKSREPALGAIKPDGSHQCSIFSI